MRRKLIAILALIAVAFLLAGCYDKGYQYFVSTGMDEKGWSQRNAEAAWDAAIKENLLKQLDDGTYVPDPSKVSVEDVYLVVEEVLADIDWVLSSSRSSGWRSILISLDLEPAFRREEQKWLYIKSQLGKVLVYQDFLEMIGKALSAADKAYNIRYLLPEFTDFVYEPEHITRAKHEGRLKQIESGLFYVYSEFGYRVRPNEVYANEAWTWKPKITGYWVVSYAILPEGSEQPRDVNADYAEFYRARVVDGRIVTETEPCVRVFRKLSGSTLEVAVIDWDLEGQPGYGVPDEVKRVYGKTGWRILTTYTEMFEELSEPPDIKETSRTVDLPPFDLKIVRVGTTEEYKGEFKEDGWRVPYPYKNEYATNYLAHIVPEDLPEGYPLKRIGYVVLAWDDAVFEYYEPVEEWSGDLEVARASGRNLVLQRVGGELVTISAKAVCGQLRRIIYRDGDTWVELVDLDGTGVLQYKIIGVPKPTFGSESVPTASIPRGVTRGF